MLSRRTLAHKLEMAGMITFCSLVVVSASKPNFVLLMADDIGWGDVSYNNVHSRVHQPGAGGEHFTPNPPRTPHLDEMAMSPHSLLFHRFYAGSAVCSPTRASVLTGRTSDRECIDKAEGCGQTPAWTCPDNLPLSPRTWTIAKAARTQGYATIHVGKWHLGNFFPKPSTSKDWKNHKWPVSSPRIHGFDEWHSTEASASSSMCNCGCEPSWASSPAGDPGATQGIGCVTGGGNFTSEPFPCTNYWAPTDLDSSHRPSDRRCAVTDEATLGGCVSNSTAKIPGDDTSHIMDVFEDFLARKAPGGAEAAPFLAVRCPEPPTCATPLSHRHVPLPLTRGLEVSRADPTAYPRALTQVLWLHTNHNPHPAMPEWYHAYTDVYGEPAGDFLGTISQMDAQIGRLRAMLRKYGVAEDTALWFTADNGPSTLKGGGCEGPHARTSNQATNGLRQCKASLYEGGIREPGILEWPRHINAHRETSFPAYVSDYLPTFLDATGSAHPQPTWAADGISLMPLLRHAANQPPTEVSVELNRSRPLGFQLGKQQAWIDNEWKLVRRADRGLCKTMLAPYTSGTGTYLFNLAIDPTESHDLSSQEPGRFSAMSAALDTWATTISTSQTEESQCQPRQE